MKTATAENEMVNQVNVEDMRPPVVNREQGAKSGEQGARILTPAPCFMVPAFIKGFVSGA
jgi:hypothetical protein